MTTAGLDPEVWVQLRERHDTVDFKRAVAAIHQVFNEGVLDAYIPSNTSGLIIRNSVGESPLRHWPGLMLGRLR